jgi:hypothetical protein
MSEEDAAASSTRCSSASERIPATFRKRLERAAEDLGVDDGR